MTQSHKKSDLIFFYSHENCPARATALPVLAWLAEELNIPYDGYFCVKPSVADIGDALPFVGNQHHQQFHFVCNFYDHVYFFVLAEQEPIQFERFLMARGNCTILKHQANDLIEFYRSLFDIFQQPFPNSALIFSAQKFPFSNEQIKLGDFEIRGESRLDSFCYPEIFFRKSLGVHYELSDEHFLKLKSLDINRLYLIFCPADAEYRFSTLGFEVEVIDVKHEDDTLCDVSERIARRWLREAKGFALGNDPITLRWTPKYLRERILTIGAVASLPKAVTVLGELTTHVENKLVWGSQIFNDLIISDASKHDIVLSLAHDVEVGITIKNQIKMSPGWIASSPAPWDEEYQDEQLVELMDSGKIPVCFVHYASDLGHLPVLPRLLDLHSIDGFKSGIAFPASWWEYAEELVEQLYLSKEMGGVFPDCEPLISSTGMGVATEARGYLSAEAYLKNLQNARAIISKYSSEKHVPIGHYAYQDACPRYEHNSAHPQFEVLLQAGFEYAISYKNENQFPQIVFSDDNFVAINQQVNHWSFDPLGDLQTWEQNIISANKPGWIVIGMDSPFWGMVPCYFGIASKGISLTDVQKAMTYANNGGESQRLVLVKPHEVARFALLVFQKGSLS
ncbi:MAG TPA: hypothetical protein ENN22_00385 [bacterium]|nr:hypothetical protein [bacterium]